MAGPGPAFAALVELFSGGFLCSWRYFLPG
jgi:hypothetical protein